MVSEEEIIDIDMSVQKGLKLLMTTGIAFEDEEILDELSGMGKEEKRMISGLSSHHLQAGLCL